jgi:hypothetical protein
MFQVSSFNYAPFPEKRASMPECEHFAEEEGMHA